MSSDNKPGHWHTCYAMYGAPCTCGTTPNGETVSAKQFDIVVAYKNKHIDELVQALKDSEGLVERLTAERDTAYLDRERSIEIYRRGQQEAITETERLKTYIDEYKALALEEIRIARSEIERLNKVLRGRAVWSGSEKIEALDAEVQRLTGALAAAKALLDDIEAEMNLPPALTKRLLALSPAPPAATPPVTRAVELLQWLVRQCDHELSAFDVSPDFRRVLNFAREEFPSAAPPAATPPCTHVAKVLKVLCGGEGPDDAAKLLKCERCGATAWEWCDGSVTWSEAAPPAAEPPDPASLLAYTQPEPVEPVGTCIAGCGATKYELLLGKGHRPGCKLGPREDT